MADPSQKKSNIITYVIVAIILLVILIIIFKEPICGIFKGNGSGIPEQVIEKPAQNEAKETVKENPIDVLIKEAEGLGEEQKYTDALTKLDEAKIHMEPFPTTEQNVKIDELIKRFSDLNNAVVEDGRADETAEADSTQKNGVDVTQENDSKAADAGDGETDKTVDTDTTAKNEVVKPTISVVRKPRATRRTPRVKQTSAKKRSVSRKPIIREEPEDQSPIITQVIEEKPTTTQPSIKKEPSRVTELENRVPQVSTVKTDADSEADDSWPSGGEMDQYGSEMGQGNLSSEGIKEDEYDNDNKRPIPELQIPEKEQDESLAGDIIDRLIRQAKKLGDDDNKYIAALEVLDTAKNYKKPEPTDEQHKIIDALHAKYKIALAEKYYQKGRRELSDGNNDQAIVYFNKALGCNLEHVLAHSYKGTAYLRKKEYDKAIDASNEAIKRQSNEPNAHFTKGEIYYAHFKDPEAEAEYNIVVENDPTNAYAYYKLGVLNLLKNNNKKGIAFFDKALAVAPGLNKTYQKYSYYNKGVGFERLNEYGEAKLNYGKALGYDEAYVKAHIQMGEVYYKEKKYDQAVKALRNGLKYAPEKYELTFLSGKVLEAQAKDDPGKLAGALNYYKQAASINPDSFEALYNAGRLHLKQKEYNEAIDYFDRANEIKSDDYALNVDYGATLLALNRYDSSLQKYEKARGIDSDRIDAYIGLGATYFAKSRQEDNSRDKGDLAKVVEHLETVNEKNSEIFGVNKTLGTAYFCLRKYDEAQRVLEKANSLNDSDYIARKNLGIVYFVKKDFEKAIEEFKKAEGLLKGDDAELYMRMGESYFKLGDKENAKIWFTKLVEKFPEYKKKRKVRIYLRASKE